LEAESDDPGPILFTIIDNNSNGIPDVVVTGTNGEDATYNDIDTLVGLILRLR